MNLPKSKWLRLIIFYLIALGSSFLFMFAPPKWYQQFNLPYHLLWCL